MANNPTPDIKNAGFFTGATELAQYLVETGAKTERENMKFEAMQKVTEIDGQKYRSSRSSSSRMTSSFRIPIPSSRWMA